MVLPVFPKYFLQQEQVTLYTTPHVLSLFKGFVRNFDFSDKDLVNITSKPCLLATHLSCSEIFFFFSYSRKGFGVSKFWLFFDLLLDENICLIVFVNNFSE